MIYHSVKHHNFFSCRIKISKQGKIISNVLPNPIAHINLQENLFIICSFIYSCNNQSWVQTPALLLITCYVPDTQSARLCREIPLQILNTDLKELTIQCGARLEINNCHNSYWIMMMIIIDMHIVQLRGRSR